MTTERILGAPLEELRATRSSVKWRLFEPDVLPVWVAELDARACPQVADAVVAAVRRGDTGYAWAPPFAAAFAGFARSRWGWEVDPGTAFQVPDTMIGIEEIIRAVTAADAPVVVSPPCYNAFYGFVESLRRRCLTAPLGAGQRLDLDALADAFVAAGPGSAYLLCNPQNPTGTVHSASELAALARLADEHEVLVISDEIHAPLTAPGAAFTPYLTVAEASRGIAVVSASKAWNLAGLKAALAFPGAAAGDRLARMHEVVTHGANHVAVIAQTAAYEHGGAWLDQLNVEIAENRALLAELLAQALPEVRICPAEATYLAWLDCSGLALADPVTRFHTRGRVALSPGRDYDPAATQWARFNLGTSPEVIQEAVRRMAASL